VVDSDDVPLFGLDWVLAFEVALPNGVQVCTVTLKSTPTTATADVRLRQLLDEYSNNAPAYILSRFSVTQPNHMTSITVRMGEQSQLLYLKLQDMPISKQEIRKTCQRPRAVTRNRLQGKRLAKQ
jgi:hypothetical protein